MTPEDLIMPELEAPEEKPAAATKTGAKPNQNLNKYGQGWYVVYTMGHEDKVKQQILKRAETMGAADSILEIFIPKKVVTKIKAGKRLEQDVPKYQRYIFINMSMDDNTYRVVRHTPGVLDVIVKPMSQVEVARLFGRAKRKKEQDGEDTEFQVDFEEGDEVKIEGGAFDGFIGKAESIDLEHGKVTVLVSVFGRFTPVDLTVDQVRAIEPE